MQVFSNALLKSFRSIGKIIGIIFPDEFTIHFIERGQKFHVQALRVFKHENRGTYSDSSRRADHFSYIIYFNPNYGLKDMNFQSFMNFWNYFYLLNSNYLKDYPEQYCAFTFYTQLSLAAVY